MTSDKDYFEKIKKQIVENSPSARNFNKMKHNMCWYAITECR